MRIAYSVGRKAIRIIVYPKSVINRLSPNDRLGLKVLHQYIPNGDDVAHTAGEDEEMEYAVHIFALVQTVEHGTRDVADTLCDNPDNRGWGYGIYQRLECDKYR